jgi:hypothetical protein
MLTKRISKNEFANEKLVSLKQTIRNIQPTAWVYEEGDPFKRTQGVIFTLPDGELVCVPYYGGGVFAFHHAYYMVNPDPAITAPSKDDGVNMVTDKQIAGSKGARLDESLRKWLRDSANTPPTITLESAGPEPR